MFDVKCRVWLPSLIWLVFGLCGTDLSAQQLVFVDFDSETSGGEHFYTASEREQILEEVENDYAQFLVFFTETRPSGGEFSTVTLNDGPGFGIADGIDFRNLNKSDNATVNVNSGASTSQQFVILTATVVSHELGHLLGLRHGDSFGPIGSGIDSNTVGANSYTPAFRGPRAAVETQNHVMETDDFFIEDSVDQFFSERSAIRLTFNEIGTTVREVAGIKNTRGTAQDIELRNMTVPNTLESGDRFNLGDFDVDALAVIGSLSTAGQSDVYRIGAEAGDLLNIEVISEAITERLANTIDPQVTVFDQDGNVVDYYGETAFNDDEFETFDSILIDLVLPEDGDYFIQINAFSANDTGSYELFVHRFNGIAESAVKGDFDGDNDVDVADIDFYRGNIESAATGDLAQLDLNSDGQITLDDLEIHVTVCVQTSNGQTGTFLGDVNFDGTVDVLNDAFILIDNLGSSATSYAQGDINLSGVVDILGDAFTLIDNLGRSNDP